MMSEKELYLVGGNDVTCPSPPKINRLERGKLLVLPYPDHEFPLHILIVENFPSTFSMWENY